MYAWEWLINQPDHYHWFSSNFTAWSPLVRSSISIPTCVLECDVYRQSRIPSATFCKLQWALNTTGAQTNAFQNSVVRCGQNKQHLWWYWLFNNIAVISSYIWPLGEHIGELLWSMANWLFLRVDALSLSVSGLVLLIRVSALCEYSCTTSTLSQCW